MQNIALFSEYRYGFINGRCTNTSVVAYQDIKRQREKGALQMTLTSLCSKNQRQCWQFPQGSLSYTWGCQSEMLC